MKEGEGRRDGGEAVVVQLVVGQRRQDRESFRSRDSRERTSRNSSSSKPPISSSTASSSLLPRLSDLRTSCSYHGTAPSPSAFSAPDDEPLSLSTAMLKSNCSSVR